MQPLLKAACRFLEIFKSFLDALKKIQNICPALDVGAAKNVYFSHFWKLLAAFLMFSRLFW
jgi:hypothetical protein